MTKSDRIKYFEEQVSIPFKELFPKNITEQLDHMNFFTAPASRNYHGSYEGGLFDHSFRVMRHLVDLTQNNWLEWGRPCSPYIVGMFHDLCKCDNYIPITQPFVNTDNEFIENKIVGYEWNKNALLKGHGEKSVMLLSKFMTLTDEEIMCIAYHMGAFTEKEEWNNYTNAVHNYRNVLWTHHADMLASHVEGI